MTSKTEKGMATREALLDAAREIFIERGFAETSVTDVVSRAEASVGSLYHHFSGKASLYVTLFEEFQERQLQRTKEAVKKADGPPMALFIAGARAYLDGCIRERELAALFLRGDGPPGFEVLMRDRLRKWTRRNAALLKDDDGALTVVMTGALAGAVSEVTLSQDGKRARRLAEDMLEIIGQIRPGQDEPGPPA